MCVTFKSLSVNITLFLINKNILQKKHYATVEPNYGFHVGREHLGIYRLNSECRGWLNS